MANNKQRTILVTGATGKQGGAALRHLRTRSFPVRVLTRDPAKPTARKLVGPGVELARGDMEDAASLRQALDGVYGVFGVQIRNESGVESEVRQGINLATAAQRAQVSHFVYSSVGSADQHTGIPHFESKFQIEEHIRGLGMPYTILRPVFFMENLLGMKQMLQNGKLASPLAPDRTLQMIAVDDIGAFTALAFEKQQRWLGRAVDIAGDEITLSAAASILGRFLGREIQYTQLSWEEFDKANPPEYATMWRWFQEVGYHADIAALRQEQRLTTFERWVQTQDWKITQAAG